MHIAFLDVVQARRVKRIQDRGVDVDPDFIDRADYGTMSKLFRDMLRKFRDLPCHFAITALERRDVDDDSGKVQYGPSVTPGLQTDLLGYVDFVIMTKAEDEDGPFRGLTRSNSRYRAKDRFDVLPKIMVDPTFLRVMDYVTGEMDMDDPSTDPEQGRYKEKVKKSKKDKDDDESDDEGDDEDSDD
jgi:hypothetical protein